jgi:acyl carrier protein
MILKDETLRLLEEMLDLPPHTLKGSERLKDLEAWDSLSTLIFIGAVDKQHGMPLPGGRVAQCQTIDELCVLVWEAAKARAA